MPAELRTWEEVLAAVEADYERTATLLTSDVGAAAPLVLPPLAAMPAVPEHLRDRVRVLRDRIDALQAELAAAVREWQVPARPAPVVALTAPRFLDRRV